MGAEIICPREPRRPPGRRPTGSYSLVSKDPLGKPNKGKISQKQAGNSQKQAGNSQKRREFGGEYWLPLAVFVGSTKVIVGSTKMIVGSTKVIVGSTKVVVGSTKVIVRSTEVIVGSTQSDRR